MIAYFECSCHSPEHRLVFQYEDNADYNDKPEMFTEVHLHNYNNIFKRIWIAIKYVFGYKSKYGCFDCFIMTPSDAEKMVNLMGLYLKDYGHWVTKMGSR